MLVLDVDEDNWMVLPQDQQGGGRARSSLGRLRLEGLPAAGGPRSGALGLAGSQSICIWNKKMCSDSQSRCLYVNYRVSPNGGVLHPVLCEE